MSTTVPRAKRTVPAKDTDFVPFSVRLPGPLYNQFNDLSKEEERTLNAQIVYALREWYTGHGRPQDPSGRGS